MSEQKSNPEEKKSPKKLILIIVAALLLIGGGGAGYYFFMRHPEEAKDHKAGDEGDKKHSEKSGEEEAKHEAEPEEGEGAKVPVYVDLTQPIIVNFPKGSGASLVQVSLSFLADSEETATALKKHEPMVRNNLMMKINAQMPEALKTKEGKEQLRAVLLEEMNAILDKMAHGKHVKEVFYTTFVMQ